jgi:hypothetical protein
LEWEARKPRFNTVWMGTQLELRLWVKVLTLLRIMEKCNKSSRGIITRVNCIYSSDWI